MIWYSLERIRSPGRARIVEVVRACQRCYLESVIGLEVGRYPMLITIGER